LDISKASEILKKSFHFIDSSSKEVLTLNELKCPVSIAPGKSYRLDVSCHTCEYTVVMKTCSRHVLYLFSTVEPSSMDILIPVLLNESMSPYSELSLSAAHPSGSITVNPSHIVVQPVPLGITVQGEFLVTLQGFSR
jgi:hypothetical protein